MLLARTAESGHNALLIRARCATRGYLLSRAAARATTSHSPKPIAMIMVVPMIDASHITANTMRLRSRAAEELAREAADRGEPFLHFPARERLHAHRTNRRDA